MREPVRGADDEEVERVLRVQPSGRVSRRPLLAGRAERVVDDEADRTVTAGDVPRGGADQVEEVALDPLAREVVGHGEDERVALLGRARLPEPGAVRGFVECGAEA